MDLKSQTGQSGSWGRGGHNSLSGANNQVTGKRLELELFEKSPQKLNEHTVSSSVFLAKTISNLSCHKTRQVTI